MSNITSTFTLPPASPGGSRLHVAIVWLLILVSAGVIAADNFKSPQSAAAAAASVDSDITLEISSRYVVGAASLTQLPPEKFHRLLSGLDLVAKTPADRLCVAMVAGQVAGRQAALYRLDSLWPVVKDDPRLAKDYQVLHAIYAVGAKPPSSADFHRLEVRYGWFGKLARAFGAPRRSPAADAALNPAQRTLVALALAAVLGLSALVAGLTLFILALCWLGRGRVRLKFSPPAGSSIALLEAFAVYVALIAVSGIVFRKWPIPPGSGGIVIRIAAVIAMAAIPIIWPMLRGMGWGEFRQAVGWHSGRGAWREIFVGLAAYIGGLPILILGIIVTGVIVKLTGSKPNPHPIIHAVGKSPAITAQLLILACVYAPIAEETLFRGALFGRLRGRFGWLVSASIVSLIFASLHPQGWVAIPILFSIAMILAAIREWRGSVLGSMAAHALNNSILLLLLTVCLS